jgi:hypothetical protein
MTGKLHLFGHLILDGAGGFHFQKGRFNTQGVSGTGLTTGDEYQVIRVGSNFTVNGKVGFEVTDVKNFRFISQGDGSNFLLHSNFHMTVHPDGL